MVSASYPMAGKAIAMKDEYPIASMMGGKIETGVAPSAASNVPNPMLMIMICTIWSFGAIVLISATTRAIAPLSSMMVICKIDVATISVMGREQTAIALLAIENGGNVRVGTEDYPFVREGVPAKNNAELVKRIAKISREMGRDVATPQEARKIIGL